MHISWKRYEVFLDLILLRNVFFRSDPYRQLPLTAWNVAPETFKLTSTREVPHVVLLFLLAFLPFHRALSSISKTFLTFFVDTRSFCPVCHRHFRAIPVSRNLPNPLSCKLRTKFCNYPEETFFLPRWALFSLQPCRSVITTSLRAFFIASTETFYNERNKRPDLANHRICGERLNVATWRLSCHAWYSWSSDSDFVWCQTRETGFMWNLFQYSKGQ